MHQAADAGQQRLWRGYNHWLRRPVRDDWHYVATVDTWDGVAAQDCDTRPQTRAQYTPSTGKDGNNAVQVCYDKDYNATTNPCHSQVEPGKGSSSLIGFDFHHNRDAGPRRSDRFGLDDAGQDDHNVLQR